MEHQQSSTATQPQADGADRPFDVNSEPDEVVHGRELGQVVHELGMETKRRALTQVGDLLRAIDRKVLRDVLPAWARLTALAGVRVMTEDWTGGRAKFSAPEDRNKAWARLSGLVALALANAESLDAQGHWRLASSFLRYLALLEYQNAIAALNNQRELGLSLEQVTTATGDVRVFGSYAGVLS